MDFNHTQPSACDKFTEQMKTSAREAYIQIMYK